MAVTNVCPNLYGLLVLSLSSPDSATSIPAVRSVFLRGVRINSCFSSSVRMEEMAVESGSSSFSSSSALAKVEKRSFGPLDSFSFSASAHRSEVEPSFGPDDLVASGSGRPSLGPNWGSTPNWGGGGPSSMRELNRSSFLVGWSSARQSIIADNLEGLLSSR